MLKIFHVVFLTLSFLCGAVPLQLNNGATLMINSSHSPDSIQLVIAATGQPNLQFQILSEALSPIYGTHNLTFKEQSFHIYPRLSQETVLFNSYHHQRYWLAFTHPLPPRQSNHLHFLPMRITEGGETHELLLPTMNVPLSFLPQNCFYRCENVLLCIQKHQEKVQITTFSRVDTKRAWSIEGQWDKKWRDQDRGIYYGKAIRHNGNIKFQLVIYDGNQCTINSQTLELKNERSLEAQKYYQFDQVFMWATQIVSSRRQGLQDL